jgi:hypothetical protein
MSMQKEKGNKEIVNYTIDIRFLKFSYHTKTLLAARRSTKPKTHEAMTSY